MEMLTASRQLRFWLVNSQTVFVSMCCCAVRAAVNGQRLVNLIRNPSSLLSAPLLTSQPSTSPSTSTPASLAGHLLAAHTTQQLSRRALYRRMVEVAKVVRLDRVEAGQAVYIQGETAYSVYVVLQGSVGVWHSGRNWQQAEAASTRRLNSSQHLEVDTQPPPQPARLAQTPSNKRTYTPHTIPIHFTHIHGPTLTETRICTHTGRRGSIASKRTAPTLRHKVYGRRIGVYGPGVVFGLPQYLHMGQRAESVIAVDPAVVQPSAKYITGHFAKRVEIVPREIADQRRRSQSTHMGAGAAGGGELLTGYFRPRPVTASGQIWMMTVAKLLQSSQTSLAVPRICPYTGPNSAVAIAQERLRLAETRDMVPYSGVTEVLRIDASSFEKLMSGFMLSSEAEIARRITMLQRNQKLFRGWTEDALRYFCQFLQPRQLQPGEVLWAPGQRCTHIYFVVRGSVEVQGVSEVEEAFDVDKLTDEWYEGLGVATGRTAASAPDTARTTSTPTGLGGASGSSTARSGDVGGGSESDPEDIEGNFTTGGASRDTLVVRATCIGDLARKGGVHRRTAMLMIVMELFVRSAPLCA